MDSHLGWQHRHLGDWQALSVLTCPLVFRACAGGRQSLNGSPSWIQNVRFGSKTYSVDPKRREFVFKLRVRQARITPPSSNTALLGFLSESHQYSNESIERSCATRWGGLYVHARPRWGRRAHVKHRY
jgi:hypothetical protein